MAVIATPLVPSNTNSIGTAFGAIVGGMAVKWLVTAPFILKLATVPFLAAVGATPMGLAGIGGIVATSLATYAATHIAEVREAAKFVITIKSINATPDYSATEPKNGAFNDPPPLPISNENKG